MCALVAQEQIAIDLGVLHSKAFRRSANGIFCRLWPWIFAADEKTVTWTDAVEALELP